MKLQENIFRVNVLLVRLMVVAILSLFTLNTGFGQNEEMRKKIEAARIALITERLNLTPKQAEKFWPIYNEFTSKRRAARQDFERQKKAIPKEQMTEEDRQELVAKGLELKEQEVVLEKEYSKKMLKVISTEQMLSLRGAEGDFRKMLMERINRNRMRDRKRQEFLRDQRMRRDGGN